MWWLFVLLATALVAFFVVKTMKATTEKQQAQNRQLQQEVLDNSPAESGALSSDTSRSAAAAGAAFAGVSAAANGSSAQGIDTGNAVTDIAEMVKILNLAESDASRLNISREAFVALRQADSANMPDAATVDEVASRLRKMLA